MKLPRTSHEAERIGYKRVNDICKSKFKGVTFFKGADNHFTDVFNKENKPKGDKKKFIY